jgi:hypothetical protein
MQSYTRGLLAVDKQGNRVLFLDPDTYAVQQELNAFPPRPHELLMLPEQEKAYVPIYGDGIHGDNPHPGHKVAVINLRQRQISGFIDLSPLQSPHVVNWGVMAKCISVVKTVRPWPLSIL